MGQTSKYKIPYPDADDIADVPGDLKTIAERIEAIIQKNIMTAGLTDDYTTTNLSDLETLKINKVFCSCGDKLTITEEGIKKLKDVNKTYEFYDEYREIVINKKVAQIIKENVPYAKFYPVILDNRN